METINIHVTPNQEIHWNTENVHQQHNYDKFITKGALCFQEFFFTHTLGQMIGQNMMLP